jgi:hypothetical protein
MSDVNQMIGSSHWAMTRLVFIRHAGEFMMAHPEPNAELWRQWGERIHRISGEVMEGYPKTVYLIEKIWVDPMENHNAVGYDPHTFRFSEAEAKLFCEKGRMYTKADCWAISLGNMPEFRCKKIPLL